jgi:FkbM family methyltransferase
VTGHESGAGDPTATKFDRLEYFDRAEPYTEYLATEAGGARFIVKTEDKHIARSLFAKRGRGELTVLRRAVGAVAGLFGPEAVANHSFVDVGANIGTTAIPAVLAHGFMRALAIEPEPENFRVLRMNILLNDVEDRVDALAVAVSNEVGRSELVVNRGRGGKHWIATDRGKLSKKDLGGESDLLSVDTVTLDALVARGTIDPDRTGMLWMDAEAHEGHILEGASTLLQRGTPLVLEWNPTNLDRAGDRGKVQDALVERYTHFAGMHRDTSGDGPGFPLLPVGRLPQYAERFLDPDTPGHKTDLLVLRLEPKQAEGVDGLDAIVKRGGASLEVGAGV